MPPGCPARPSCVRGKGNKRGMKEEWKGNEGVESDESGGSGVRWMKGKVEEQKVWKLGVTSHGEVIVTELNVSKYNSIL